jgi:Spy/CpxP family protein refolding chaperone
MLKRMCGIFLALSIVLISGAADAQKEPSGRWWRSSQVKKELKLTNGEIQRLEKAYNQSRRSIIKQKGRVEAEQFELQTMVENRNADAKSIKAQHRKLENARSDLAASKFDFVVEARKIIGHDRFQKLLKMQSSQKGKSKKRK